MNFLEKSSNKNKNNLLSILDLKAKEGLYSINKIIFEKIDFTILCIRQS